MIGISGYVGCRPAMHHALVCDERSNVPPGAARDCRGETCLSSLIMEPFSSRTYRRQILIECEMGRSSELLLAHPANLVRHLPTSSGGSMSRRRLIGQEADDDGRPPEGL